MKQKLFFTFLIAITYLSSFAQHMKLDVTITQNNQTIQAKDAVYTLKPGAFDFNFTGHNIEGFLIGATLDEDVYRSALGEADLEVNWFEESGMAEELFNPHKKLIISNDAPSYWYFTDAQDHRMNKGAKGTVKQWKGQRTISKLQDINRQREINLDKFKGKIYLFMYSPMYDEDYNLTDAVVLFQGELRFVD